LLDRAALIESLCDPEIGLAVTPILDAKQIGPAGIDIRLGPDLIVTRRQRGAVAFDPSDGEDLRETIHDFQQYIRRPFGSAVYLQPGEFAIARTLEYVTLPATLSAEALGRSSWGRLGLIIATATLVQPGFRGTITLELTNVGSLPIVLYVGMRIAQLVFSRADDAPVRNGWPSMRHLPPT
jgi:dCTP deaminase